MLLLWPCLLLMVIFYLVVVNKWSVLCWRLGCDNLIIKGKEKNDVLKIVVTFLTHAIDKIKIERAGSPSLVPFMPIKSFHPPNYCRILHALLLRINLLQYWPEPCKQRGEFVLSQTLYCWQNKPEPLLNNICQQGVLLVIRKIWKHSIHLYQRI